MNKEITGVHLFSHEDVSCISRDITIAHIVIIHTSLCTEVDVTCNNKYITYLSHRHKTKVNVHNYSEYITGVHLFSIEGVSCMSIEITIVHIVIIHTSLCTEVDVTSNNKDITYLSHCRKTQVNVHNYSGYMTHISNRFNILGLELLELILLAP